MKRVLFYDIETAPIIGTTWGKYEQNLIWIIRDWYMLMFAYKWQGEKTTHVIALPDFALYATEPENDYEVIKILHELFNEADVVVAHNGNSFDQKKSNARFIHHGLSPVSPYQQIDTMRVARKHFNFTSNKLDDLGTYFKVGNKLHTSADLWRGCMAGDMKAWTDMKRYNKQDVVLLEKVYDKVMPWMTTHPNIAMLEGKPRACPKCGALKSLRSNGVRLTGTSVYRRFQCIKCGSWVRQRTAEKTERPDFV